MSKKTYVNKFDLRTEDHLARYLANREKRTGQKWEVKERYFTEGTPPDYGCSGGWNRALIQAEDGSTLRIYEYGSCWRMGQKVVEPRLATLAEVAYGARQEWSEEVQND